MTIPIPASPAAGAFLLRKAADVLNERGWCRSAYEDGNGRVCATGALMCADRDIPVGGLSPIMGTTGFASPAYRLARYALLDRLSTHGLSIVGWNDSPGRRISDVISLFQQTADELEQKTG